MMSLQALCFLLLLTSLDVEVRAYWWLSSQVFAVGSTGGCPNIAGLVKEQKNLCHKYPKMMERVGMGANLGLHECQQQFSNERWNCSDVDSQRKGLLGLLTSKGNRETAFFFAISAAGVTFEVTRACNMDRYFDECRCERTNDVTERNGDPSFQWNGCNDNIRFGMQFAKDFLDTREQGNDARVLMNKQNNLAGRIAIDRHARQVCTCHGVSGSCNVRTCHRALPNFVTVGDYLRAKYSGAVLVTIDQNHERLVPKYIGVQVDETEDLVYLEPSPDYCIRDPKLGTLGVAGRRCAKDSPAGDGCDIMCCGMGFQSKKVRIEKSCNCKFQWCCRVHCDTCVEDVIQHFCRAKRKERRKNQSFTRRNYAGPVD